MSYQGLNQGSDANNFRASENSRYRGLKLYDAYPTKEGAKKDAEGMRRLGVQYVRVAKLNPAQDGGRLKWGIYLGGRNSSQYV